MAYSKTDPLLSILGLIIIMYLIYYWRFVLYFNTSTILCYLYRLNCNNHNYISLNHSHHYIAFVNFLF